MKAHEVIILSTRNIYSVSKYIVIANTTSKAVSLVPLRDGEEVLEAKELQSHQVIMEVDDERPEGH